MNDRWFSAIAGAQAVTLAWVKARNRKNLRRAGRGQLRTVESSAYAVIQHAVGKLSAQLITSTIGEVSLSQRSIDDTTGGMLVLTKNAVKLFSLINMTMTLIGLALASPAWATAYTIADLGTFGGTVSFANGINNNGQVVGYAYTAGDAANHAFLYSNGAMTDLNTLGDTYGSIAYGISNNGQVAGLAYAAGWSSFNSFRYSNGVRIDFGALGGAYGINDSGQVVGETRFSGDAANHAFLYSNGAMTDLNTLGGTYGSNATGINDNGQVVGGAYTAGNSSYSAFLYSNGAMTDLGTLGGTLTFSEAIGINNNGQVVGFAWSVAGDGAVDAFLYSNGAMIDLGTLGGTHSVARGINDNGQVVGDSYLAGNQVSHAFLYSGGSLLDLNSLLSPGSGWTLLNATGINDNGQIVGFGAINGQNHAFLMTQAVPEPADVWMFSTGLICLVGIARKRKHNLQDEWPRPASLEDSR